MEALQSMSAPHARVIRDGKEVVIDAVQVVPGDIILVEAGDNIPADARLIESASLKSEESALTGESVPSEKDASLQIKENAPLGDRANMIYSGCSVAYGRGRAVVTATGMNTGDGTYCRPSGRGKRYTDSCSRSWHSWASIWDFWLLPYVRSFCDRPD